MSWKEKKNLRKGSRGRYPLHLGEEKKPETQPPKPSPDGMAPLEGESGAQHEGILSTLEATTCVPGVHMSGWNESIALKPTLVTPYNGFNES